METIRINLQRDISQIPEGLVVALGFFDGLHTAHMSLIKKVIELTKSTEYKTGVITFDPYPAFVLEKTVLTNFLTPLEVKKKMLAELDLDYLVVIEFDRDIAKLSHRDFVQKFFIPLNVKKVVAGFDNRYGYKGEGSIKTISADSDGLIEAIEITAQLKNNKKVGSSMIRKHLDLGEIVEANEILGRPYRVDGFIIHGRGRGKAIGLPTANLALNHPYKIPKEGVYAVRVNIKGKIYYGICNIGHNPTFNYTLMLSIEVNIFDFDEDVYGEYMAVEFLDRIRDEVKFETIDELLSQVDKDIKSAKEKISLLID